MTFSFWPRLGCAVVCWFLTVLALCTIVNYYIPSIPVYSDLPTKLLWVVGAGMAVLIALIGTLAFWLWLWIRE